MTVGWLAVILAALMFVMGVWNTAGGPSGGITFAILAATLSPVVAIPIQSIVEGVSGVYRSWLLRHFHHRAFLLPFVVGGTGGFVLGFPLLSYVAPSERMLFSAVAVFMLVTTWVPIARAVAATEGAPFVVGAVTSFLSLFIGGMGGPISTALAGRGVDHYGVIATSTTAVNFQYVLRLLVFGFIGFSFGQFLPLIATLTASSLAGTWLGSKLLIAVDKNKARLVFNVAVTAIGIGMLGRGAGVV